LIKQFVVNQKLDWRKKSLLV